MIAEMFSEAHSAIAVGIAERFLQQPHSMAWEQRCDELATAAIEAMQIFILMSRENAAEPLASLTRSDTKGEG